ncbi:hypothetical protein HAX54_052059, partial [Datura stramonium]|nr:hypothetical protein [Datura stramonium]
MLTVMYRSVHVYRTEAGKEEKDEREYLLYETSNFEETKFAPVITLYKFDVSKQFVGNLNGVWKCMFVYDSHSHQSTSVDASPEWLSISENPKMECIPTLSNDLRAISELSLNVEFEESSGRSATEESGENKNQRAASEDIAKPALEDLAKYFGLPIVEASKSLKTVSYLISRSPTQHRKICNDNRRKTSSYA